MALPPRERFCEAVAARLAPAGRPGPEPFAAGAALAQAGAEDEATFSLACAFAARAASTAAALSRAARSRPEAPGLRAAVEASLAELGGAIALLAGRGSASPPFALAVRARDELRASAAFAHVAAWRGALAARGRPPEKTLA
jgi:hypothetical protein